MTLKTTIYETQYDLVDEFRLHSQEFALVPKRLNDVTLPCELNWKSVKFEEANKPSVSKKKGVYAFIVKGDGVGLPPHGYVMYMGISKKRARPIYLRTRYGEYLSDQKKAAEYKKNPVGSPPDRYQIGDMLCRWDDAIHFFFAEVENNNDLLPEIEKTLNDAMVPPKVTLDFSVKVRRSKKAWM